MAYVEDRVVHDADSHLMEMDDCLDPWFDKASLAAFRALPEYQRKRTGSAWKRDGRARHDDDALKSSSAQERDAFHADNFIDLMGEGLAADLRWSALARAA